MRKMMVLFMMIGLLLTGCTSKDLPADQKQTETEISASEQDNDKEMGNEAENETEADESDVLSDILSDQIEDQSFEVKLDGWGDVTFASFMPENNGNDNEDVRFKLLQKGKVIYSFPDMSETNSRDGEVFEKIAAVSFKDYNKDGKMDIIIISKYQSVSSMDDEYNEVRLYSQRTEDKKYSLDSHLNEYLMKNYYDDSIAAVMEGIDDYYSSYYSICTSKTKLEVEAFAKEAKEKVLSGDWTAIAAMTAYPIEIMGVEYVDAKSLKSADIVLSPKYISALKEARCEELFANYQGMMLGNGELWMGEVLDNDFKSEGLKILAINAEE